MPDRGHRGASTFPALCLREQGGQKCPFCGVIDCFQNLNIVQQRSHGAMCNIYLGNINVILRDIAPHTKLSKNLPKRPV